MEFIEIIPAAQSAQSHANAKPAEKGGDPMPKFTRIHPFTLYQHKVIFDDPPLDYDVSKYKLLVDFAGYSPCIFTGNILFMARAVPPKNRIGFYYNTKDAKKSITWSFQYIGIVNKRHKMYDLFNKLIFKPGLDMKIFNLENKSTNTCMYEYDKRFRSFSIIPIHYHYKTTIRFSGFHDEILYCSEFADPSSPKQKHYDFVPNLDLCVNGKECLIKQFTDCSEEEGKEKTTKYFQDYPRVLAPYSGKIYKVDGLELGAGISPKGSFVDRYTPKEDPQRRIKFIDHYKSKYGIEIPKEDQEQLLLLAFPTENEDMGLNNKMGNFYLLPSLCYILNKRYLPHTQ